MPRSPANEPMLDELDELDELDDRLVTGEAVALELRPAAFVLRAAGGAIDLVAYLGFYVALVLIVPRFVVAAFDASDAIVTALLVALLVLAIVVAPITVEQLSHGKSLGRLAVGARIVRNDGGAIGFRHSLVRALVGVFENVMTFGGIAVLSALLSPRSQRLGDLLAGTYSQYERVSKADPPVYGVPVALTQWAVTADVARLPDRLSRRVAQFLRQAPHLSPSTRDRLSRELAGEAAPFVSPLPAVDAELFLAGVAAVRREREAAALALEAVRLERLRPVLGGLPNGFPER